MKLNKFLLLAASIVAVAACSTGPVVAQPGYPTAGVQYPVTKDQCAVFVESMQPLITSAACGSGGGGTPANPTATIGTAAVNGVATTYMRSDAAPALGATTGSGSIVRATSPALTTPTGIVKGDVGLGNVDNTSDATKNSASATLTNKTINGSNNTITNVPLTTGVTGTLPVANGGTGITALGTGVATALGQNVSGTGAICLASGSACSGGASVSVTSASSNIVINPTPGTGTFTVGATYPVNAQTGTTYTILSSDLGKLVTFSNGSSVAVTVPQATSTFGAGASFDVQNKGAGVVTLTPTTSTVNGSASISLAQNQGCTLTSDGTNWQVAACTALGGSGVTSVAATVPGGFSISGSPVTSTGTLAISANGTSGGVPYYSGSTTMASSGALTANLPVIGGGAGAAPTVGTRSGNTTAFVTTTGTQTSGRCVEIDANGNHIAAAAACGSGGGSAGFAHPGYVTNWYYTTPVITRSDYAVNANQLYTIPFVAGATDTFTKIGIRVKTGAGSTACEIGWYTNTNGRPGAIIADLGNVATTASGYQELTGLSIPVTAGNTYWLAVGCNGSPTLRGTDTQNQISEWFIGTDDADYGAVQISGSWTYSAGALPGTFPTPGTGTSKTVLIFLRK